MRLACPRCRTPLAPAVEATPTGKIWLDYCPSCRGVWFDRHELARLLRIANRNVFSTATPLLSDGRISVACPRHPLTSMYERQVARELQLEGTKPLYVDQCPRCGGLWLDGGELPLLSSAIATPVAQRAIADATSGSTFTWIFLALTGLPIEEWHPRVKRPIAVFTLIAVCSAIFAGELTWIGNPDSPFTRYALVPSALIAIPAPWMLVSYLFLHGGIVHLLGNLYFLWLFGDDVEDRLGVGPFLVIYFSAGICAAMLHALLTSEPDIPVVGASGAISGVLATYAILFPRARLVSVFLFLRIRWSATAYLGAWFAIQVLHLFTGGEGIAWWAHVGGFIAGGLAALVLRRAHQLPAPVLVPQRA